MFPRLNYHHLHYFWAVARDGNLTRTAERLRVSQSALSAQIRLLEQQLGERLFERVGRRLELTEAGRVVLAHADAVFAAGADLLATLDSRRREGDPLRVGAAATLSRNFQESFLRPLLGAKPATRLLIASGAPDALLARLERQELDVLLTNRPMRTGERTLRSRLVAKQAVSIVGPRAARRRAFPDGVDGLEMILPGPESQVRIEFDAVCERAGVQCRVLAEVDDMAMIRLLVRDSGAHALVPSIVVRDELADGVLRERCRVPGLAESFFAVTGPRRFPHPALASLLTRGQEDLLSS